MDTQLRFDRIVEYLADQFAGGNKSIHKADILENGTVLGREVGEVLSMIRRQGIDIGADHIAVDALDTFAASWFAGFELAGGDDLVTDNETVSEIICEYHDGRMEARQANTAAPTP